MADTPETEPVRDFLARHAPFDRMAAGDLDFLVERLKPIRFSSGEAVTDPDAGPAEWFYILRHGRIIGMEQGEDERISGNAWELVPGECFPLGALDEGRPVHNAQRAEGEVECLTMAKADFAALRGRSGPFDAFCSQRLGGLLARSARQVRAEAVRELAGDASLNLSLGQRPLRAPLTCPPETPVRGALAAMAAARVGSMVVTDGEQRPIGIFTLNDLLRRVALAGLPLDAAIEAVMTSDPVSVPPTAFAFEAAMRMAQGGIHHLCVVEEGRLVGVISERDLFSMQRVGLVRLTKSIARAGSVEELARLAGDIHQLVAQMMAEGARVGEITQMITLLNDQIVRRTIAVLAGDSPEIEGIAFAWLAFGSEGRQEQTLKTDQDNGILFALPEGGEARAVRARLLPFAGRVNQALDRVGFTLCPADIMASNPECCLSFEEWRRRFARWIDAGTPENLLKASIFLDFRAVAGPEAEARVLRAWLGERAARMSRFLRQMAENALRNAPPLGGLFRDFRLSGEGEAAGTLDLKVNGVTIFIDAARIMALGAQVPATNTLARLDGVAQDGRLDRGDVAAWTDAYDYIRMLRMRVNQEQAAAGAPLTHRVAPDRLSELDRRILKEAFREGRRLQAKLALDYQI
ncbi:DUF294 nucleotidyltransferase-like domain-containing protein [soil metagenome]